MKRYEGLFIFNTAGKEEGIKEAIDKVTSDINALGGRVETTQKMEKKNYARVADKRFTSGFYVNFIFHIDPKSISTLRSRLALNEDVFRVMFTEGSEAKAEIATK